MGTYFNIHNHTMYSNIRLLDCINRPTDLIDKAIELGLSGIAITDHECLSAHMEVNQYAKKIKEKHPDFIIALGNEVYLVDKREPGIKYNHFILTAKDEMGHKALRELSSIEVQQDLSHPDAESNPSCMPTHILLQHGKIWNEPENIAVYHGSLRHQCNPECLYPCKLR